MGANCSHRLVVRTPLSHSGSAGSIPAGCSNISPQFDWTNTRLRTGRLQVRALPERPSSACRGAWPSLPALEAGDRWFESNHADQCHCPLAHLAERRALNAEVPGSKPGGAANHVAVAKWERCELQPHHEPVRSWPATPMLSRAAATRANEPLSLSSAGRARGCGPRGRVFESPRDSQYRAILMNGIDVTPCPVSVCWTPSPARPAFSRPRCAPDRPARCRPAAW